MKRDGSIVPGDAVQHSTRRTSEMVISMYMPVPPDDEGTYYEVSLMRRGEIGLAIAVARDYVLVLVRQKWGWIWYDFIERLKDRGVPCADAPALRQLR
jgi:hypothetical protein